MARGWWWWGALWMGGSASAQVPITMSFDQVLVAPIQPASPELSDAARRLDALLVELIGQGNELVDISSVPPFEELGYDAGTYMAACPPDRYEGCMLVVAQRAEVEWAIGGELEPADLGGGEQQLTVHVVDVAGSREVMAFGVVVDGADDRQVLEGVARVFDSVLAGLADEVDLRERADDPRAQAAYEARRDKLIASSLARLEEQLGEVIREEISIGRLDPPRLTRADLAEWEGREDVAPWDRLGMTRAQYLRFGNSGASLVEWRRRLRGRFGQVLVRGGVGASGGPWGLHHEGRWLVAFDDASGQFYNAAIRQYQEARREVSSTSQLEVGVGVAPWVEVGGAIGLRTAPFTYHFDQDDASDPVSTPGTTFRTPGRTSDIGARVQVVPLPTYQVRPTAHAGVFAWRGGAVVPGEGPLKPLPAPRATYVQLGAGVEASAGRYLNLFARGHANLFAAGRWYAERQEGDVASLLDFDEPLREDPSGWGFQAGVQLRISLLPDPDDRVRAATHEEDEPDL